MRTWVFGIDHARWRVDPHHPICVGIDVFAHVEPPLRSDQLRLKAFRQDRADRHLSAVDHHRAADDLRVGMKLLAKRAMRQR